LKLLWFLTLLSIDGCSSSKDESPTPDDDPAVLNTDNYRQVVDSVLGVYSGTIYSRKLLLADEFFNKNDPISSFEGADSTRFDEFACDNEGTVSSQFRRT